MVMGIVDRHGTEPAQWVKNPGPEGQALCCPFKGASDQSALMVLDRIQGFRSKTEG
jgi:hypothetical protein